MKLKFKPGDIVEVIKSGHGLSDTHIGNKYCISVANKIGYRDGPGYKFIPIENGAKYDYALREYFGEKSFKKFISLDEGLQNLDTLITQKEDERT